MEHAGASFPPEYVQHRMPLTYDGEEVQLSKAAEEVATWYAELPLDGPQLGDPEWAPTFNKNFMTDFKKILGKGHRIKDFNKIDWSGLRSYTTSKKLVKRSATDEEKAEVKAEKQATQAQFGLALVDGHLEKVGNFTIELPGLFRGRGKHPKTGKVKQRVLPEQLSLNFGEEAAVPICPIDGHGWGAVQHDPSVTWLVTWRENIMEANKYVMLAAMSSLKGKSDRDKYGKASKLKGYIGAIRDNYRGNLQSRSGEERQMATAMWLIDIYALRVGGEKGEDEADTVGCCSLRVEHFTFSTQSETAVDLEFLGKDSMRFKQTIDFANYGNVGLKVLRNIKDFCKGKRKNEDVFEFLNPSMLNAHLQSIMPGLTAKVFRTYNASETLQNELPSAEDMRRLQDPEKVVAYNEANRKVAILCNHQKTVSAAQQEGLDALQGKVAMLKKQKRELQAMKKKIEAGDTSSVRTANDVALVARAEAAKAKAEKLRNSAKTDEQRIKATKATEEWRELRKRAAAEKFKQAHLFKNVPSDPKKVQARIVTWTEKIRKQELTLQNKSDNKEVALGTSKINYMDPRITVAWCKRVELPIERVFARTLRDKFNWAMAVPPDWRFEAPDN
uniref:DNA topoisomerase 1 n=1 Tax=Phaeomonas parva TaxID=124430 RepID=A0A7S1TRD4_9STRA